ncbi:MAG: hypothetical protein M3N47_11845 [Chloroflexota bacterium]|nr:hypothetical protein [Chloroflexota bacterium]
MPTVQIAARGEQGAMCNRSLLLSILLLVGCGGEDDEAGATVRKATLQQILNDPERGIRGRPSSAASSGASRRART